MSNISIENAKDNYYKIKNSKMFNIRNLSLVLAGTENKSYIHCTDNSGVNFLLDQTLLVNEFLGFNELSLDAANNHGIFISGKLSNHSVTKEKMYDISSSVITNSQGHSVITNIQTTPVLCVPDKKLLDCGKLAGETLKLPSTLLISSNGQLKRTKRYI